MGFDPFAPAYDEMARRSAPGSLRPGKVPSESSSSSFFMACVFAAGGVMVAVGAWVPVGVLTKGGPVISAAGLIGTIWSVGRASFRSRQGAHWFELQQTRAELWAHLPPGHWEMPRLAAALSSHFPSEMEPVLKAWRLSPPDGSTPDPPSGESNEPLKVRDLAFEGLTEISKVTRLARSCPRCKGWIWLRHVPTWATDVDDHQPTEWD